MVSVTVILFVAEAKLLLLSKYTGYDVYPYFDGYGDLKYVLLEYTATNADTGEDETTVKLFSAEEEVTIIGGDTANAVVKPNKLKKIPIIIYDQNRCDWEDVKPQLNAYDRRSSKLSAILSALS